MYYDTKFISKLKDSHIQKELYKNKMYYRKMRTCVGGRQMNIINVHTRKISNILLRIKENRK